MKRQHCVMGLVIFISLFSPAYSQEIKTSLLMNSTMDVSKDFADFTNQFFFADKLVSFDGMKSQGLLLWKRKSLYARQAFNTTTVLPQDLKMLDFPDTQYENDPKFKFSVDFVSAHTIRIRLLSSSVEPKDVQSLMLVGQPPKSNTWVYSKTASGYQYKSNAGTLIIESDPWRILLYNSKGKLLTSTRRWLDDVSVSGMTYCLIKKQIKVN